MPKDNKWCWGKCFVYLCYFTIFCRFCLARFKIHFAHTEIVHVRVLQRTFKVSIQTFPSFIIMYFIFLCHVVQHIRLDHTFVHDAHKLGICVTTLKDQSCKNIKQFFGVFCFSILFAICLYISLLLHVRQFENQLMADTY